MTRVATALVHYPCLDKHGQVYATSITNLDVHDVARSSRTYDVATFYVVTPIDAQRDMARAITGYWAGDEGMRRNATRTDALSIVDVVPSLEDAIAAETKLLGAKPVVIATSAKQGARSTTYAEGRAVLAGAPGVLLVFGTGHGLAHSIVDGADHVLAPIPPRAGYNHLSVRSAVAIILDRLLAVDER